MLELPETQVEGSQSGGLFYQSGAALPTIERGEGIYLWDKDGKKYIDSCSGCFAANVGHGDPRLLNAAKAQLDKIAFAYRTQFENDPANQLAELLSEMSPKHLNRVFLVNSGSEAVESCIKLARQYWWAKGQKKKSKIISRRPSYHGSTLGALALTSYHDLNVPFETMVVPSPKVSAPFCYRCPLGKTYPSCKMACAHELEQVIAREGAENIAAFITEPIGGASTGGAVPPDEWFPIVEKICRKNEILFIVDEVLTGCGRTGAFYAFEHWGAKPDLVSIAKGISAGYSPVGACIARPEIVDVVVKSGGFMHGHTLAGNPLSAAISVASLQIIAEDRLIKNAAKVGAYFQAQLKMMAAKYSFIGDVRGKGLLAGLEFVADRNTKTPFTRETSVGTKATAIARGLGLLIYPRRSIFGREGDHISLAPPLNVTQAQIDEIVALLDRTLQDVGVWLATLETKDAA